MSDWRKIVTPDDNPANDRLVMVRTEELDAHCMTLDEYTRVRQRMGETV